MTPDLRALADEHLAAAKKAVIRACTAWSGAGVNIDKMGFAEEQEHELLNTILAMDAALRSAADQLDAQKAEIETKQDFIESGDAEIVQLQAEIDRQWQPIETAPKDATAVLVMRNIWPELSDGIATECNEHNTYVAQWWSGENRGHGAWVCYMDAVHDPLCPIDPTHWMPLPKAPT